MNISQYAHFEQPDCLAFETHIVGQARLADGRQAVMLERTWFYPTGGGQECDFGELSAAGQTAAVTDVIKEEDAGAFTMLAGAAPPQAILHVTAPLLPLGPVLGQIDAQRRWRHRQHHTAQHLLSYCFVHLFHIATISSNINGDSPSTIDLNIAALSDEQAAAAEALANAEVYANHPVKTYIVTPEQAQHLPLRKRPAVSEDIRIIEIEGCDHSPCGGTHINATGSIGVIKILRLEKVREKVRLHFVAGEQALAVFRASYAALTHIANRFSAHPDEVAGLVDRQSQQLKSAQHELAALRRKLAPLEAQELTDQAPAQQGLRLVKARYDDRSGGDLRLLAQALQNQPGVVAYLGAYDGSKFSLVVACAPGGGQDAAQRLRQALAALAGKGGGDAALAQGGGAASPEQVEALWASLTI